jgi:hypothetical protein
LNVYVGRKTTMEDGKTNDENLRLQPQWHSWASPVGLGIGLLCVLGAFALLAHGLTLLAGI